MFLEVEERTLVEAYCQFSDSDLHSVINRCLEDVSEKDVDRLLKVILTYLTYLYSLLYGFHS